MSHAEKTTLIQERLNLSLKEIYPLAQTADEQLDLLKEDEKGKFSAVFQPDSGFKATANRFLPYLIELSEEVRQLPETKPENLASDLKSLLEKIQKMHLILNRFHRIS